MALKFIGERTIGALNGMRDGFVKDDLYRVYDAGILMPGGVSVNHGDFVSWDGTKWKLEADIKIARSDEISNTNSSIAPNYTKKTYEANSYVMQDGVLYTNPNAIETAEDWNPAHWTQTTVAEMMANAGGGYTETSQSITLNSNQSLVIEEREVKNLQLTVPSSGRVLTLKCSNDCVIRISTSGANFAMLLQDSEGNSLYKVVQYPNILSKEYTSVDDTDVIQDVYLETNNAFGNMYTYIRVTGHVALVLVSELDH